MPRKLTDIFSAGEREPGIRPGLIEFLPTGNVGPRYLKVNSRLGQESEGSAANLEPCGRNAHVRRPVR